MQAFKILAFLAVCLALANASHYRFGTMNWIQIAPANTIRLSALQCWRASAFGVYNIGGQFDPVALTWGDGYGNDMIMTVTSIDIPDDIVCGEYIATHTYPSATTFTIEYDSCCRISTLENNANGNFRGFVGVDLVHSQYDSPVANVLPIVTVPRSVASTFTIAAVDPAGYPLTFTMAGPNDWDATDQPQGSSVSSPAGVYTWNNQALQATMSGFWCTAVIICNPYVCGMVDFFMQIGATLQTVAPVWNGPTPANGQSFSANINQNVAMTFQCYGSNPGDVLTINAGSLPQDSSFTVTGTDPAIASFTVGSTSPTSIVACFSCHNAYAQQAPQTCVSVSFTGSCCSLNSQAPQLTGVPSNQNYQCGTTIPTPPSVTATPVCPTGVSPSSVAAVTTTSGNTCSTTITNTWSFTDVCGRTQSQTQTINVVDSQAPSVTPPQNENHLQCNIDSTATSSTGYAIVSDNCTPSPTVSVSDSITGSYCGGNSGTIQRTFQATDSCGNVASAIQTLTIVDTLTPILYLPSDTTLQCGVGASTPAVTGTATASDACDSHPTVSYSDSDYPSACLAVGSIFRSWTATDHCFNSISQTQIINFKDTIAPVTSADNMCVFPPNGQYVCLDISNPSYIHANDACSNAHVTISYNNDCSSNNGYSCQLRGQQICLEAETDQVHDTTYTFSFTVTDACGNSAIQQVSVPVYNQASASTGSCIAPETCINNCPEDDCEDVVYELMTADQSQSVGTLHVNNKLGYEVSFEFFTTPNAIPDRGWWMRGIHIEIGSERIVRDFVYGAEQNRWFETAEMNLVFPLNNPLPCGAQVTFFAAAEVTNDRADHTPNLIIVYPFLLNTPTNVKRNFPLPSNWQSYDLNYTLCCACTIRTQTQEDYSNLCAAPVHRTFQSARERAISCYRDDFWTFSQAWCFPNGITVGCSAGYTAQWTTVQALTAYFPDESAPQVLTRNWVNAPNRALGYLAAECAALQLNIQFDLCDADFSSSCNHLEDVYVCKHPTDPLGTPECNGFHGMTVGSILALADNVLGGCTAGDPNAMYICVQYINRAFVDGKRLWEALDFQFTQCAAGYGVGY